MDMRVPLLKMKITLESNPPKSRILVRRLAAPAPPPPGKVVYDEPGWKETWLRS